MLSIVYFVYDVLKSEVIGRPEEGDHVNFPTDFILRAHPVFLLRPL